MASLDDFGTQTLHLRTSSLREVATSSAKEGTDREKKSKSPSSGTLSNTHTSSRIRVNLPQLAKKIRRAFTTPTLSITVRLVLLSKVARTHSAQPLVTSALVSILILLHNTSPIAIKAPSIVVITIRLLSVELDAHAQEPSAQEKQAPRFPHSSWSYSHCYMKKKHHGHSRHLGEISPYSAHTLPPPKSAWSAPSQNREDLRTGFNVETVECKNISFTVWDVGG
ncbi:ADP-ribosylation factor [Senna tora]|uniref:ADP-ribosylation factor n=1 Tax=Senna tora TaxID=362788 RepID=A0A834TT37_9FABA|nr:ADP-ribosylation factor [Senna tora]